MHAMNSTQQQIIIMQQEELSSKAHLTSNDIAEYNRLMGDAQSSHSTGNFFATAAFGLATGGLASGGLAIAGALAGTTHAGLLNGEI